MPNNQGPIGDLIPQSKSQVTMAWYVAAAVAAFVFGAPVFAPNPGNLMTTALLLAMFALPATVLWALWCSVVWFLRRPDANG